MTSLVVPRIETVSFPVEGMTCASCVNRITRFLNKVEGVEQANVNLASESATIRYDADRIGIVSVFGPDGSCLYGITTLADGGG